MKRWNNNSENYSVKEKILKTLSQFRYFVFSLWFKSKWILKPNDNSKCNHTFQNGSNDMSIIIKDIFEKYSLKYLTVNTIDPINLNNLEAVFLSFKLLIQGLRPFVLKRLFKQYLQKLFLICKSLIKGSYPSVLRGI